MISIVGNCEIGIAARVITDEGTDEAMGVESVGVNGSGVDGRCPASQMGDKITGEHVLVEVESLRATCLVDCPHRRKEEG